MAYRIKYRKILRQVHLLSSMVILAFLLMYFVTAFILIRHDWFPNAEPIITEEVIPYKTGPDTDYSMLHKELKAFLNITGRVDSPIQMENGNWVYNIYKPGLAHRIVISPKDQMLTVRKTEQLTVVRVASRLHVMRHYRGGIKYILWSVFYDLAAVSMFVFGITGILIWLRMGKAYRNGIYWLFSGFAVTTGVLLWLLLT